MSHSTVHAVTRKLPPNFNEQYIAHSLSTIESKGKSSLSPNWR